MPLPKRLLDGYASFRAGRYSAESERYRRLGEGLQKPTVMMIAAALTTNSGTNTVQCDPM